MANETLTIDLKFDSNIGSATSNITRTLDKVDKSASKVNKSFGGIGAAISAATAALSAFGGVQFIKGAVEAAASVEELTTQFVAFTGSAEKAAQAVEELRDFTASTPFRLEEVAQAGRSLLAFGEAQENVTNRLRILGNVAAGTGSNLGDLATIFGQIQAQTRLTGERFNQLVERGVNIGPALAESLGVAESEIRDLISAGQVSAEEVSKAFDTIAGSGGQFAGSLERLSQTASGLLSTLQDNIQATLTDVGSAFAPVSKEVLKILTEITQDVGAFVKTNSEVLSEGFRDAVVATLRVIKNLNKGFSENFREISGFFSTLSKISQVAFKGIQNTIDALLTALFSLGGELAGLGRRVASVFDSDLADSLASFEDAAKSTAESIAGDIKDRSKDITDLLKDAFTISSEEINFDSKVIDALDKVDKKIFGFIERLRNSDVSIGTGSVSGTSATTTSVDASQVLGVDLGQISQEFGKVIRDLTTGLQNAVSGFASSVLSASSAGTARFSELIEAREEVNRLEKKGAIDAQEAAKRRTEIEKQQREIASDQAFEFIKTGAAAFVDTIIPGAGQFVKQFLDLARDPEAFKEFINSFIDAIPDIIEALIAAAPDIAVAQVEAIALRLPPALIKGILRGLDPLFTQFEANVLRPIGRALEPLEAFGKAVQDFIDGVQGIGESLSEGPGGTLGKVLGGDFGGAIEDIGGVFGLQGVSPVQDRTVGFGLTSTQSQDNIEVVAALQNLTAAVERPMTVQTAVNVDGQALGSAILELNRNNTRLS